MPATHPRRRLLLAAVLLIVLSGGLAVAAWARLPASGVAAAKSAVHVGPSVVAGSSSQNQPVTPHVNLAGLRWSNFYGVELPYSAAGPATRAAASRQASPTARWARCWPRSTSGSAPTRSGARASSPR